MNEASEISFNLIDKPWMPVLCCDGSSREVSLEDMFFHAHEIRSITGEFPLVNIAIVRCALAVLYCAYGELGTLEEATDERLVKTWEDLYARGQFNIGYIESYLNEVHDQFDLFGRAPFYQVAGLAYLAKEPDDASELIMDMPKPEKFLFSMRSNRESPELSFAEAARWLLLTQAYDQAGIKSPVIGFSDVKGGKAYPPKGMLGTGWCGSLGGLFLEGRNLFETLMFNWPFVLNGKCLLGIDGDIAPWERPASTSDMVVREPRGPIDLLTWQSRRMRLVPNAKGTAVSGVVLCYGDATLAADKFDIELMTSWRTSLAQQKKLGTAHLPLMPIAPDSSKALWRGLRSLLGVSHSDVSGHGDLRAGCIRWMDHVEGMLGPMADGLRTVRVRSQGIVYGTQSSVISDMVDDYVDLDLLMLRGDAEAVGLAIEVVEQADEAVTALVHFVQDIQKANGADTPSASMDVRERAYIELDELFRKRLSAFSSREEPNEYCMAWRAEIRSVVQRLARDYLAMAGFSAFREKDSMTSGRAIVVFRAALTRALGVGAGRQDDLSNHSQIGGRVEED